MWRSSGGLLFEAGGFSEPGKRPLTCDVTQLTFDLLYRLAGKVPLKGGKHVVDLRCAAERGNLDIRYWLLGGDVVQL